MQMTDSTPTVIPKQLFKALIYHILFYMVGPFGSPIIYCFETKIYIQNLGFLPSSFSTMNGIFIIQSIQFLAWAACLYLFIKNRSEANDFTDEHQLDMFPLMVSLILQFIRIFIISIRAGTTPMKLFLKQSKTLYDYQTIKNLLLVRAWNNLTPQEIMNEIDIAMLRVGISNEYFTIKTLTPIYPLYKQKFMEPDYYGNEVTS